MTSPASPAGPRCSVVVQLNGQEWRIDVQPPATIGRDETNGIVIDNRRISRNHARLEFSGASLTVVDLGSTNGTLVNGEQMAPSSRRPLAVGDQIGVGEATVRITAITQGAQPSIAPSGQQASTGGRPSGSQPAYSSTPTPAPAGGFSPPQAFAAPPGFSELADVDQPTIGAARVYSLLIRAPGGSRTFPLQGAEITLGRGPANTIVVNDPTVSTQHAVIRATPGGYEITDLGSRNGLLVDGQLVPSHLFHEGDVVRIGPEISLHYLAGVDLPQAVAEQSLPLGKQDSITIGRGTSCDVVIAHPTVSRQHARIFKGQSATGYVIEDLGSSNGTYLNGTRLAPGTVLALGDGDTIQIGPARYVVSPTALQAAGSLKEIHLDAVHLHQQVTSSLNLLQDLSLSIRPREFVALVGVSGAGKSTLMAALSGFKPATTGDVLINGVDLYDNFDAFRTTLGYVPQDDILHKELPVQRAFEYAAELRLPSDTNAEERAERVEEVIHTLGLEERRDVPIGRLSGGQRKRVSIGAELITEPGLFFLDEATSGLDPGTESQLMRLLRDLADAGHTIVLITHATKNVAMCDQVIFLARGGHLAWYGPPSEALPYFGVPDFDGIYEKLENESTPEAWGQKFLQSRQYESFVVRRLGASFSPNGAVAQRSASNVAASQPVQRAGGLSQFWLLTRRYVDIIRRDRINVLLLLLIAPALGLIDLIAWPRNIFSFVDGDATRAATFLFMSSLFPFLIGCLTFVREIVKEGAIYSRERTVVLKIAPYLASKVAVGLVFALYWAAALTGIKMLGVDLSFLNGPQIAQFYLMMFFGCVSGVMFGLLISALVGREERAMLFAIGIIVIQIVFSGGLVALNELGAAGAVLGSITSTHWVLEGLTTVSQFQTGDCMSETLETCQIPGLGRVETLEARFATLTPTLERFGDLIGTKISTASAWLTGIMVVLFGVLYVVQKRKDVV